MTNKIIIEEIEQNINANKKVIHKLSTFIDRWSDNNKDNDPSVSEVILMIKDIVVTILTSNSIKKKFSKLNQDNKTDIITKSIRNIVAKQLFKSKCNEDTEQLVLNLYDTCAEQAISLALTLLSALDLECKCCPCF